MQREFRGVWIPSDVWLRPGFSLIEKCLFAEIDSLDREGGHCTEANSYFAEFLGCTEKTVSRAIAHLEAEGLVKVGRRLTPEGTIRIIEATGSHGTKSPEGHGTKSPEETPKNPGKTHGTKSPEAPGTLLDIKVLGIEKETGKEKKDLITPESVPYRLAKLLYTEHLKIDPGFQKGKDLDEVFRRWGADIEKMIRIDGRDEHTIAYVIRWCQADTFWNSNILSGAKLREKYPQLVVRKNQGVRKDSLTTEEAASLDEIAFRRNRGLPEALQG